MVSPELWEITFSPEGKCACVCVRERERRLCCAPVTLKPVTDYTPKNAGGGKTRQRDEATCKDEIFQESDYGNLTTDTTATGSEADKFRTVEVGERS